MDDRVEVQHISVNPSHRYEGIGKNMLKSITQIYQDKDVIPSEYTAAFFEKCDQEY